jgi:nitrogenase molybdenum-iron protein beta chain
MNGNQGIGNDGGSSISCTGQHELPIPRTDTTDLLPNALDALRLTQDAQLCVVLTGCLPELIGEDVGAQVARLRREGRPVVHADLAGFSGSAWDGHERLCRAIVDQFVEETFEHAEGVVNLWSSVPYLDPFWSGDLLELRRQLEGIGLSVNVLFGCGSSVSAWRQIPSASLNLVVSPWVGTDLARHLRDRFGTPFLHWPIPPVGMGQTRAFLEAVANSLPVDENVFDRFLEREEQIFHHHLEKGSELFLRQDDRSPEVFHCVADSHTALGIARFLSGEMGLRAGTQILVDRPRRGREEIKGMFRVPGVPDPQAVLFPEPSEIPARLREAQGEGRALVLGSFWDEPAARGMDAAFVPVSAPLGDRLVLDRTYLGPRGGLRFLEDLWNACLA